MPPGWSSSTVPRILARDGYRCQQCGAPAAEVDHVVRGIEDDSNLRALCVPCHRDKTQAEAAAARKARRAEGVRHGPGMTFSGTNMPPGALLPAQGSRQPQNCSQSLQE
ncbi:MAG: HNH endonuclease [Streptosporangiales bacterium]|nr:HNH endonuclease [Streptosporangiales bacterium]